MEDINSASVRVFGAWDSYGINQSGEIAHSGRFWGTEDDVWKGELYLNVSQNYNDITMGPASPYTPRYYVHFTCLANYPNTTTDDGLNRSESSLNGVTLSIVKASAPYSTGIGSTHIHNISRVLFHWYRDWETDRKSTRLNSSHSGESRMPSSA